MTLIFHLHSSQELYQATEATYQTLAELESIFPFSAFLKTQRALLYYHSKGTVAPFLNQKHCICVRINTAIRF